MLNIIIFNSEVAHTFCEEKFNSVLRLVLLNKVSFAQILKQVPSKAITLVETMREYQQSHIGIRRRVTRRLIKIQAVCTSRLAE